MAFAILTSPQQANAEFIGDLVQINVSAGENSGSWTLPGPAGSDPFAYDLAGPLNIYSVQNPGLLLATIDSLNLRMDGDPQVVLNFAVTAGVSNTVFSMSSGLIAFGTLSNPDAFASAGITVTDGESNGGSATGLFAGGKIYEASYNAGSIFADLVSTVVSPAEDSGSGSERYPLAGSIQIPGSVSSIKGSFNFLLTANDSASATSRFNVVPEPSSVILAIMAATGLYWASRRRK